MPLYYYRNFISCQLSKICYIKLYIVLPISWACRATLSSNDRVWSFVDRCFSGFYEQNARRRQPSTIQRNSEPGEVGTLYEDPGNEAKNNQWRRILLLVVAITVSAFFLRFHCVGVICLVWRNKEIPRSAEGMWSYSNIVQYRKLIRNRPQNSFWEQWTILFFNFHCRDDDFEWGFCKQE